MATRENCVAVVVRNLCRRRRQHKTLVLQENSAYELLLPPYLQLAFYITTARVYVRSRSAPHFHYNGASNEQRKQKKKESYLTRNCASESENSAWRWNSVACFSPWRKMTYKWKGALNVSVTSNCHLGDDTLSFHSRLSCLFRFCTPLRIPRSMHAQSNTETTTSWDRLRSGTRSSLRCRGNALTTISARSARLLSSTLWFTDVKFIFCTL